MISAPTANTRVQAPSRSASVSTRPGSLACANKDTSRKNTTLAYRFNGVVAA